MTEETITISLKRFHELEAVEAKVKERNKISVERLKEYAKSEAPEKNSERVRRHIEKDRDAYNARRRELRRLKKGDSSVSVESTI